MLKAVLFDLDDTLLDWSRYTAPWGTMEVKHLRRTFDYICRDIHPLTDFEHFTAEFQTRTGAAWTSARTNLRAPNLGDILVETAVALGVAPTALDARRCLDAYAWDAVEGTSIFPEVPEVLAELRERGVKIGIVTNAFQPMWVRDTEITTHGIYDFFPDCRLSAADVGYLKPHPAIFQAALNCVNAKPSECVFVGDDPEADIAGANAAGIHAVMRITPRVSTWRESIVPDARVHNLRELLPLLDKWYPGWR